MSAARIIRFASTGVMPLSLGVPAGVYPGRVAANSDLIVAMDRQQTSLVLPLSATDTAMTVLNPVVAAYNLLSIDNEIVKTTGPGIGNTIPIQRGFDGTVAAAHIAGATVQGLIDAYHHNVLVAEIEAIENTLGANPFFNIQAYGAVCDGVANDTAAFQAAVSAAAVKGGTVLIPVGTVKLTPDTITIPWNVNVIGQGQGNSILIPSATGTTFLKVTGASGSPDNPTLRDFQINLTAFPALSGMDLSWLNNATFERIYINGGTYGMRLLLNVSQTHLRSLRIYDATNTGLYVNGDTCAEVFYDDVDIARATAGTMQYGLQITRTTLGDVGAHYMKRVRILGWNAGSAVVTNGLAITGASSSDAGTIILGEQLVMEQITGPSLLLQKASIIHITGSWMSTTGANSPTIQFDGSDNVSIVNCNIINGGSGPLVAFVAGTPVVATTFVRFIGNRFAGNGVVFQVTSTNPPLVLTYQTNSGITVANLTNDLATFQAATYQMTTKYCAVNVGSAFVTSGIGTPVGYVAGNPGDLYLNMSGGAGATLWVKESGTGTLLGWVAK